MPNINNYVEDDDDGWDDLFANNADLDSALKTSVYSNRSQTPRSSPKKTITLAEYHSMQLREAEEAQAAQAEEQQLVEQFETMKLKKGLRVASSDNKTLKFKSGVASGAGLGQDDSDVEDGIEFPDKFQLNNDVFTTSTYNSQFRPSNMYAETLDLSEGNVSSADNSSSSINSASLYSESETDATTDFYNDIEIDRDDFEQLLELRLLKARRQAEMEEREYLKRHCISGKDIMNLADDTFVWAQNGNANQETDEDYLDDFDNFEHDMTMALNNNYNKNIVFKKPLVDKALERKVNSKKSMPILRTISPGKSGKLRKASSTMVLNDFDNLESPFYKKSGKKKIMVQPMKANYGSGTELDFIDDLDVDYNKERIFLNLNGQSTLRGSSVSSKIPKLVDISQFVEKDSHKGILKKSKKPKKKQKLGLIKNLSVPQTQVVVEGYNGNRMVYNPNTFTWEGNDYDTKRFNTIKGTKPPGLITFLNKRKPVGNNGTIKAIKKKRSKRVLTSKDDSDFEELSVDGLQIEGNMYFNPRKLCWFSLENEDEEDPFKDIVDLDVTNKIEKQNDARMRSSKNFAASMGNGNTNGNGNSSGNSNMKRSVLGMRSNMGTPQMFTSSTSSNRKPINSEFELRNEYQLSKELVEKFEYEEERWIRKVKYWFQPEDVNEQEPAPDREYLYEIRNMVIGNNV